MRIGAFELGERPLVVAELGNNHEGDPGVARELVRAAADAGADAVKLQTFRRRRLRAHGATSAATASSRASSSRRTR